MNQHNMDKVYFKYIAATFMSDVPSKQLAYNRTTLTINIQHGNLQHKLKMIPKISKKYYETP